jgi:putative PEP-CTERM system TPR-repeat lipoprotein
MRQIALTVILSGLMAVSCSSDPQRAFQSANDYVKRGKLAEAIVEYRKAVQIDPRFGEARYQLAETYLKKGDRLNATREYVRAADLLPDRNDVQIKAASYLLFAGQFQDAKTRAEKVLARDPKNVDAQILVANALAVNDLSGAVQGMERALASGVPTSGAYSNLGVLQLAKGNREDAEKSFRHAIEIDPQSTMAHLAMANFFWSSAKVAEAERELQQALAIDPANPLTNRALASVYLSSGKFAEAEQYLKKLTELSPDPEHTYLLADYYVAAKRPADAVRVLEPLTAEKSTRALAMTRLAALKYDGGDTAQGHALIDALLKDFPKNAAALGLKARFLFYEKRFDDALTLLKAANASNASLPKNQSLLGAVYLAKGDTEAAFKAYNDALKLDPGTVDALLPLAQINLTRGNGDGAAQFAQQALNAMPEDIRARLVLVRSLVMTNDIGRARRELDAVLAKQPRLAEALVIQGETHMAAKDLTAARASFEKALQADPKSQDALTQLVALDMGTNHADAARTRIENELRKAPSDPNLLMLSARVYATMHEAQKAEAALRRVLDADAANLTAYSMLGQLFIMQGKSKEALEEFTKIVEQRPSSIQAQTTVGILLEQQNRPAEARQRYEKILQIDPRAAVAANNLAWLYANTGANLDVALQLAQTAKSQLGNSPEVSDTLGWIYLKKKLASLAVGPLQFSADKDPKNAVYQYHLGLAYAGSGDKEKARKALQRALTLQPTFEGAAEARQVLATLG